MVWLSRKTISVPRKQGIPPLYHSVVDLISDRQNEFEHVAGGDFSDAAHQTEGQLR